MYFKFKVSNLPGIKGIVTFLTEANNFAEAAYKIIQQAGTGPAEVEEIKLMKNFKPAINEKVDDKNKLYMIKIAEDAKQDDGSIKTIKYELPCFANDAIDVTDKVNNYLEQGLENMRLTTISETKWIFI